MKKIFGILMLASVSFVVGCDSMMNQEPIHTVTDAKFWKTEADVSSGVAGGYSLLRAALAEKGASKALRESDGNTWGYWGLSKYFAWGDLRAALAINASGIDQSWGCWAKNNYASMAYSGNTTGWDDFYMTTEHGTICLQKIGALDVSLFAKGEQGKRHYMGEAMFLRTWAYWYLTKNFGDVVFVREVPDDPSEVSNHIARTPKAEVRDSLINDCRRAIDLLSWNDEMGQTLGAARADKGAAYVLLAEMLLTRGATGDYNEALTVLRDDVIGSGKYQLVDASRFDEMVNKATEEDIFELYYDNDAKENLKTEYGVGPQVYQREPYVKRTNPQYKFDVDLGLRIWNNNLNDERYAQWLDDQTNATIVVSTKYKGYDIKDNTYWFDDNWSIYRLGGVYLFAAEAALRCNLPGVAKGYLDDVKDRAGADLCTGSDEAYLWEELANEYMRELFLEGQVFYHLMRIGKQSKFLITADAAKGTDLLPVLPRYFSTNKYMTQNQAWAGVGNF